MANKFVWSGAGGLNDGSSWDNAYTTLMKNWGSEAGFTPATDYIYVRSVHSESSAASLTVTGSAAEGTTAACRILCVVGDTTGTTPGNLSTGATVNTTTALGNEINIKDKLYIYGVNFLSYGSVWVASDGTYDNDVSLEQCRIEITSGDSGRVLGFGANSYDGTTLHLKNVTLDFSHASQTIQLQNVYLAWEGGVVEYDVNTLINTPTATAPPVLRICGVDFSALTSSALCNGGALVAQAGLVKFVRCLLATGGTIVSDTIDVPGFRVESYHCQIGTDADPSYQMEIQDSRGKVSANTAKYRTGGASDGVRSTPISWDFDTTAGSVRGYPGHAFEGPPISAWTTGDGATQHTYRVAFASDASIKDDELWMELEGPNDAATNSLAALKTTRVAPQGTAAAYTTDSGSTWTGTGVGTMQYMQVQYTPDKPGPVTVRVYMAKASDNIYVDPNIQIDPA